ncbi:MAG: hypothetical protein CMJ31_14670 [Phycisphaerae bacterium]|nr:hypothetical protein [Phycisphaerae bacterium]
MHAMKAITLAATLACPAALAQTINVVDFNTAFPSEPGADLFGSFATDTALGSDSISIDTTGFGGAGIGLAAADFDSNAYQVRIRARLLPGNVADSFAVGFVDNDGDDSGPGLGSETWEWRIPTDLFSEAEYTDVVYSLGSTGIQRRQADGSTNDGDGVPNFGGAFFLLQSEFEIRDRLAIEVDEIVLEPVCLTADYYVADFGGGFSAGGFGSFGNEGALTETNDSLQINVASFGGGGRSFPEQTDFDPLQYRLRVQARLLPGNGATQFRVVLADSDGDDSADGLGTENYEYPVNTALLNTTEYTDVFIPISSGENRQQNFNSDFDGDEVINFGASEWFIQSTFDSTDTLAVEIREIAIVPIETTPGFDFNVPAAGLFTYGSFSGPMAIMQTGESVVITAASFGGLGENDGTTQEIDASSTSLEVTGRALMGNEAASFNVILLDRDGDDSAEGTGDEEYQFQFNMVDFGANPDGSVDEEGELITVLQPLTDPGPVFRQQGFNSLFDGDMIQNYGLYQWQFASNATEGQEFAFELVNIRLVQRLPLVIDPDLDASGVRDVFDVIDFILDPIDLTNDGVTDADDVERFFFLLKCACPS